MPLFIDYHEVPDDYSLEDLRLDHQADLALSQKYGIQNLQYWFNKSGKTVFCLIEASDMESCNQIHLESCGETACNIQEVEPLMLSMFMGRFSADEHDMIVSKNGRADHADRTILMVNMWEKVFNRKAQRIKKQIADLINMWNGRFLEHDMQHGIIGIFDSTTEAIKCAEKIKEELNKSNSLSKEAVEEFEHRISLNKGQPLNREGGFFEITLKQSKRLCLIANPNEIIISSSLKEIVEMQKIHPSQYKLLTGQDEQFLYQLFEVVENHYQFDGFNINYLCKLMGISRTLLYRKTTSVFGKSPHQFITEIRMRKAWQLVKSNKANISEIAFELGYSNPSHFSRIFRENFGFAPSELRQNVKPESNRTAIESIEVE